MTITVGEFLGMALHNNFEFCVYDFSKVKDIFEGRYDEDIPEEIEDMIVESWNIYNGKLELNVNSNEE